MDSAFHLTLLSIFILSVTTLFTDLGGTRSIDQLRLRCNSECMLALRMKLRFSEIGEADLILLDGISSKLASAIMIKKNDIIFESSSLPEKQQYTAFAIVKGIGQKKAALLGRSIKLN